MLEANTHCNQVTGRQILWCVAMLFLGLLLWHGAVVLGTQVFCGGDLVNQYYPVCQRQVQQGWFTGWLPETFSGRPVIEDIQTGTFYPPNWLCLLGLPVIKALSWLSLLHLLWGGLGMYLFSRCRLQHGGAMLAAFLWTFSAYQQMRITSGIIVFTFSLSWVSWMLLAAERQSLFKGRGLAWTALLALFGAMQLNAGAAQVCQITWVGLGIWTLGRMIISSKKQALTIGLGLFVAGLVSLLISTPLISGVLAFKAEAYPRGQQNLIQYLQNDSLQLRLIWTWIFPELFCNGVSETFYWGSATGYHETNAFLGVAPIIFSLFFFIVYPWKKSLKKENRHSLRWIISFLGIMVFAFLISMGSNFFLFGLFIRFVPSFDLFRVPARWIMWVTVGVCVFAGWGLDYLLKLSTKEACEEGEKRPLVTWAIAGGSITLFILAIQLFITPLLTSLGIDTFIYTRLPNNLEEAYETLLAVGTSSVRWELLMSVLVVGLGFLLLSGKFNRRYTIVFMVLVVAMDLIRFWIPFSHSILTGVKPEEIETEVSFHRISSGFFEEYFFPETELVKACELSARSGRIHYDNTLLSFYFDQYQREFLMERPVLRGIEHTRGYQQLILKGYTDDYYMSNLLFEGAEPDALMGYSITKDGRFFDAYNITKVLSYQGNVDYNKPLFKTLKGPQPIGARGLAGWENPTARGWAWLSENKEFLEAVPGKELGSADITKRDPDFWTGLVETTSPCWLHLSSPEYSGWKLSASGPGEAEVFNSRSVYLPKAGTWTFERKFTTPSLGAASLLSCLSGLILVVLGLFFSKRGTSVENEQKEEHLND